MRGADVGSDHYLIIAKVKLKLRKVRTGNKTRLRFDTEKLKDPATQHRFQISLQNRFRILQNEAEISILEFNQAMEETGKKILGYRRSKKEEWITQQTWSLIDERKEVKNKLLNAKSPRLKERLRREYSAKDKQVKSHARNDKRRFTENLATKAEEAARKKDMKTLYQISKRLRGDTGANQEVPVKAADGTVLTSMQDKIARWREHFQEILNRPDPTQTSDIPEAEEDLDVNLGPITVEEVRQAIKSLKSGKAPGKDGICPEMLKAESHATPEVLKEVFQKIWDGEQAPEEWSTGIIVKLPKKGDLGNCNNWRGITLLPMTSKVFTRIILNRVKDAADSIIRQEQAGFRKGRSCIDHIFTLRQILEQSTEWNSPIYTMFIDFTKAFDSLHRESLWKILRHHGIPVKMVSVIKLLYQDMKCQVICDGQLTDSFTVRTGVKQGCILSPFLFTLAVNWLMTETTKNCRRGIRWTLTSVLEDLDYADDIDLLSSRHKDMQDKTNKMVDCGGTIGLAVNIPKTKLMRKNHTIQDPIYINDEPVEEANSFVYLGSHMTPEGDSEKDAEARIIKANQAFGMLKPFWRNRKISTETKLRIYKSNVLSVLLYGAECWKVTSSLTHKLETFQNKCLRNILNIYWPIASTISNQVLLQRTSYLPVATLVKRRRWTWIGHISRMPPNSHTMIALGGPQTANGTVADPERTGDDL